MVNRTLLQNLSLAAMLALILLAALPTSAQDHEHRGLSILTPANGASVSGPLTVTVGFAGGGGGGGQWAGGDGQPGGPQGGHRGGGRQLFLLIDQPAPEPGASIQPDPNHIAFPEGQNQTSVTLAPGKHSLQLAVLDREGKVGRRFHAADPVTVTVQ